MRRILLAGISVGAFALLAGCSNSQPAAISATGTGTPRPIPTASPTAIVPGSAMQVAIDACGTDPGCLSSGTLWMGIDAAYVRFTTSLERSCYVYLYQDASGWHLVSTVCAPYSQSPTVPDASGFSPVRGEPDTVQIKPPNCVHVRKTPGLQGAVVACLRNQTSVLVSDGPDYVDGKLWWYLSGKGWMAHDYLVTASSPQ